MQAKISRGVGTLLAALLLALVVVPVALAADRGGAEARSSAGSSIAKTLKKLRKQVGALQRQVAALEGQSGAARPPSGPAGGDLTGTYPNPLIGPNAVGGAEIQSNAVTGEEIADDAVLSSKVLDGSLSGVDIGDGTLSGADFAAVSIGGSSLLPDTIGGRELKGTTAVVGPGVDITAAGGPVNAGVACPGGAVVIGGGYAWQDDEANSIIASAPSEASPSHVWIVRGMVNAGSNRLFAWANCLAE